MASIGPYAAGEVLGQIDQRTGFLLSLLGQESMRDARDVLTRYNLKPRQLRILDLLADRGSIGQRELGDLMGIDHSILVGMLNPLEAEKLAKRERDPDDRRRHLVTITPAGRRRLAEADKAFKDAEEAFMAPLTERQRTQLRKLLLKLRRSDGVPEDEEC